MSEDNAKTTDELKTASEKTAAVEEPANSVNDRFLSRNTKAIVISAASFLVVLVLTAGFLLINRIQEKANEAQVRLVSGQAAMADGDLDLALFQFREALRLNPKIKGANRSLGILALIRGKGPEGGAEAMGHFEVELTLNPDDRQSHLAMGCLNALGLTGYDPTGTLRYLLLERFQYVLPVNWSMDLAYVHPAESYPLANAIYHFQYAAEKLPGDSAPVFGLSLAHLANNDIPASREKLTRLTTETENENAIAVAQLIMSDINGLEMFLASLDREHQEFVTGYGAYSETGQNWDSSVGIPPLASLPGLGTEDGLPYGSYRPLWEGGMAPDELDGQPGSGLRVTPSDLLPQPTVKPISHDIKLDDSQERIRTVRIANIYQRGSVGFRVGETIVMPYTNVEVTVVEADDSKIVLEESGNVFTWVRADVGWDLLRQPAESGEQPNETTQEEAPRLSSTMGPEVPSGRN
ncbi:MAG TPA: hypothetical protein ENN67_00140 [Firmicutes bacterium]|nr:hypothetical protein [Bacillota bacterium]